jgi:hypothetical protein
MSLLADVTIPAPVRIFGPWVLGLCVVLTIFGLGFRTGQHWDASDVAEAKAELSSFNATLSRNATDTERHVGEIQADAMKQLIARMDALDTSIAGIPGAVGLEVAPQFTITRNALNAPQYACLRIALPPDVLGVFARPGGSDDTTTNR